MTQSVTVHSIDLRRLRRRDVGPVAAIAGDAFDSQAVQRKVAEELAIYCDDGIEEESITVQRQALPREYYVILLDNREIGLTGLYRFHWAWEGEAWLGWTAIDSSHQSKGIGSEVLASLKTIAYEQGFRILHVETELGCRAQNFYLRNGFRASGVLHRHYGSDCDALVLSCDLEATQRRSGDV
jgi:GNAT superfamily N-acetyltransferase